MMKTIIVLATHGAPPNDFFKYQVALLADLYLWREHTSGLVRTLLERYHTKLDTTIRTWPRTFDLLLC